MRSTHRVLAVALAGLLAAGCGGGSGGDGDGDDTPDTTPPPETPSTSTGPDLESEVEGAYLAYWDMAQRLVEAPDPNDAEIAERTTEPVLGQLTDSLTTLEAAGRAVRHGPRHAHNVQSVQLQGHTATVHDCSIDDAAVIDVSTDATIEERLVTALYEATLVRQDSSWRVSEIDQPEGWEGVTGCA